MIIAIDGPSASGKGTLAKKLAQHFGLPHLDTGLLYRAVALTMIRQGIAPENEADAIGAAEILKQHFLHGGTEGLDDPELRSEAVSQATSKIAAIPAVRAQLLDLQRKFAYQPDGVVLDGRDIGTVVVPDAPVKIFVQASAQKRAERRWKELQSTDKTVTYEAVLNDMQARDARDAARAVAPTIAAEDAVLLDTSDLNAQEAFAAALQIVKNKMHIT